MFQLAIQVSLMPDGPPEAGSMPEPAGAARKSRNKKIVRMNVATVTTNAKYRIGSTSFLLKPNARMIAPIVGRKIIAESNMASEFMVDPNSLLREKHQ